jgi:hypothetical protein
MSKETFDPDPRRKGHKRKGGLPKSIIRKYGISKRAWQVFRGGRTHDPSRVRRYKTVYRGPKGGKFFQGPTKRRYDPGVRSRLRGYGRRIGGKAENFINKYATWIGTGLAALVGIGTGINKCTQAYKEKALEDYVAITIGGTTSDGQKRIPEIAHLWQNDGAWTPLSYLKYKFGIDQPGGDLSSWAVPFWASLIGYVASKLPLPIPSWARIRKPLGKIAAPALVISTIGALALPGSGEHSNSAPTSNSRTTGYTYVGR